MLLLLNSSNYYLFLYLCAEYVSNMFLSYPEEELSASKQDTYRIISFVQTNLCVLCRLGRCGSGIEVSTDNTHLHENLSYSVQLGADQRRVLPLSVIRNNNTSFCSMYPQ